MIKRYSEGRYEVEERELRAEHVDDGEERHLSVCADDVLRLDGLDDAHLTHEEAGRDAAEDEDEEADGARHEEQHAQILQVVGVPHVLERVSEELLLNVKQQLFSHPVERVPQRPDDLLCLIEEVVDRVHEDVLVAILAGQIVE